MDHIKIEPWGFPTHHPARFIPCSYIIYILKCRVQASSLGIILNVILPLSSLNLSTYQPIRSSFSALSGYHKILPKLNLFSHLLPLWRFQKKIFERCKLDHSNSIHNIFMIFHGSWNSHRGQNIYSDSYFLFLSFLFILLLSCLQAFWTFLHIPTSSSLSVYTHFSLPRRKTFLPISFFKVRNLLIS